MEHPRTEENRTCCVDRDCSTGRLTTLFSSQVPLHGLGWSWFTSSISGVFPPLLFLTLLYYFARNNLKRWRSFHFALHVLQVPVFTHFSHHTHGVNDFFPFRYLGVCSFISHSPPVSSYGQPTSVYCFMISINIPLLRRQILLLLKHQFEM